MMAGDSPADVAAGRATGVTACIRTAVPSTRASADIAEPPADFTCETLLEAADGLLDHELKQHV